MRRCRDPSWMRTSTWIQANGTTRDTFYPAGTKCYVDPSRSSCFLFGNSGSGVIRSITPKSNELGLSKESTQYAYTGPLSMSKSCDDITIMDEKISYGAENPGIFTDAYCYLPWIASEYGMRLPDGYVRPSSCDQTIGDRRNINLTECTGRETKLDQHQDSLTSEVKKCNFNHTDENGDTWDRCRLYAEEGYAYNIYTCKVRIIGP